MHIDIKAHIKGKYFVKLFNIPTHMCYSPSLGCTKTTSLR